MTIINMLKDMNETEKGQKVELSELQGLYKSRHV